MLRTIIVTGLAAGLIAAVPISIMSLSVEGQLDGLWGMAIGYLLMLLAFSLIFVAIKRHRDRVCGGVIGFWRAFGIGIAISAVAGIVYTVTWEVAQGLAGADFAKSYSQAIIAQQRAAGASAVALAKTEAEMAKFRADYANPLIRWPMTFSEIFPIGLLVSIVSAGLLRNSRLLPARRDPRDVAR